MGRLLEKLGLPKGHYYLHVAVLAGLPIVKDKKVKDPRTLDKRRDKKTKRQKL